MMEDRALFDEAADFDDRVEAVAPRGPTPSPEHVEHYRLGMPHLCLNGLSESWLLKELGHRHWMMLARLAGQTSPQFFDGGGAPVYAAFCALSIRDADFGVAAENDLLRVRTRIERVSQTQTLSRHRLDIGDRALGKIELLSAFVRRQRKGQNHSVARFEPPGLPRTQMHFEPDGLAARAAAFRAGRIRDYLGFRLEREAPGFEASFSPCPSQDFNGAGLLYFAQYIAFVDRAEWMFRQDAALSATTQRRDVFFFGNLDPGETLTVRLMDQRFEKGVLSHHCRMIRDRDQSPLAELFSIRSDKGFGD